MLRNKRNNNEGEPLTSEDARDNGCFEMPVFVTADIISVKFHYCNATCIRRLRVNQSKEKKVDKCDENIMWDSIVG